MKLGITMFATDRSMDPVALATEAEARGYHSFYVPEHTHIPSSRITPAPTGEDTLPDEYSRTLDPFVTLAACASVTDRLLLGTGICLLAQRDALITAKAVATLDLLSQGRFVFGVGFGWNREEMQHHGVDPSQRRAVLREKMLAMQELWSRDEAAWDGEHVSFESSWSWPKPLGGLRPPVLIGGAAGPTLFRHVAEYADGWMPIGGAGIRGALPDLHRAMEEAGRDPAEARVVPFGTMPDRDKLGYFADLGIEEVVFRLPSANSDTVLRYLDDYQAFMDS